MSKNIVVAKILTSHGVKGFVKLESYLENPKDVFKYENNLHDIKGKNFKASFVGTVKSNIFITKIDGISDMDIAKSFSGTELFLEMELLPKNNGDEFYYNELIGLEARTVDKKSVGIVKSVDDFGAGVVVEIKWEKESMEESIPLIKDYFKEVNVDEGYVLIDRPSYI